MKYIIVKKGNVEYGIIFPDVLTHRDVARVHRIGEQTLVSAGFCERRTETGWFSWGESESLGIGSRPHDDEILDSSFPLDDLAC